MSRNGTGTGAGAGAGAGAVTGTVAFIHECLTSERERRSFRVNNNTYSATPSTLHTLQERQWMPITTSTITPKNTFLDREIPLALCWDHTGRYCAEGGSNGSVTIWNFEQNTIPYNAFDRQGTASFTATEVLPLDPALSACIAWSPTCNHIYMALNYDNIGSIDSERLHTEGCETSGSVILCWSLNGDEKPVFSRRLLFHVQSLECLPVTSPHTHACSIGLVSTSGILYFANDTLEVTNMMALNAGEPPSHNLTASLETVVPYNPSSFKYKCREICCAPYLTKKGSKLVCFALFTDEDTSVETGTKTINCRLLRFDTKQFDVTHEKFFVSYACPSALGNQDTDIGTHNYILKCCPITSEILVIISPNSAGSYPSVYLCSSDDLSIIHDYSSYFLQSCAKVGRHVLASATSTTQYLEFWGSLQDVVRIDVVGGGFIGSSKYTTDRYIGVRFMVKKAIEAESEQWTCYFRIDDVVTNDRLKDIRDDVASLTVAKDNSIFSKWVTCYKASCITGIYTNDNGSRTDTVIQQSLRPSVYYAADEKLYSYFAGANFPAGFVVLDRAQLFVEHEDETDIVVQKKSENGKDNKGKRTLTNGDQRGGSSGKRNKISIDEINSDMLVDVWSNECEGSTVQGNGITYEEIDRQGFELECYLNGEVRRRQQWKEAGGWSAKALPVVSKFASTLSGSQTFETEDCSLNILQETTCGVEMEVDAGYGMNETQGQSAKSNSNRGVVMQTSIDDPSTKKISFLTTTSNVPQRVLTSNHNIAMRAVRETQVNRRILSTIFKSCDKAIEIKKRAADALAEFKRSKEEKKEQKKMLAKDVGYIMEMLIQRIENNNSSNNREVCEEHSNVCVEHSDVC